MIRLPCLICGEWLWQLTAATLGDEDVYFFGCCSSYLCRLPWKSRSTEKLAILRQVLQSTLPVILARVGQDRAEKER